MSEFVIEQLETKTKSLFDEYIAIKTTDERWKNNKPYVVSKYFEFNAQRMKEFGVFCDDVWLVSFIKAGL
jgi:hypothetical protein